MQQLKRTIRVKLDESTRMTGCLILRCACGSHKYLNDEDFFQGIYECLDCGRPFAYIDDFYNVYPIGQMVKKGRGGHV